jgi:hypothetical protein
MDLQSAFLAGEVDLAHFLAEFELDCPSLLEALKRWKAVVTGGDFLMFMAGEWKRRREEKRGALMLDVVCHGLKERAALREFLVRAGYRENPYNRCHNVLEWNVLPKERVTCMVRGDLHQRVVHIFEVPREPAEVALSRAYGTAVGTYLTGTGRVVSLFPHLTFVKRRCWMPLHSPAGFAVALGRKYVNWTQGGPDEGDVDEVGAVYRKVGDEYCWLVRFSRETGEFVSCECPDWKSLVFLQKHVGQTPDLDLSSSSSSRGGAGAEEFYQRFPSMMASLNADALRFGVSPWMWNRSK